MATTAKVETVAEIADKFRTSSAAVVTEYRGLKMSQLTELRRALGTDTAYTVAKNTLVKRAAADAGVEGMDELFVGPTAVAFINGEPVDAAKALRDFAKNNPLLVIKGGLMDGKALSPAEVGKLAGAMKGTLTKAAIVLNALPTKTAQLVAALQEKKAAGSDAAGASDLGVTESVEAAADTSEETASA